MLRHKNRKVDIALKKKVVARKVVNKHLSLGETSEMENGGDKLIICVLSFRNALLVWRLFV